MQTAALVTMAFLTPGVATCKADTSRMRTISSVQRRNARTWMSSFGGLSSSLRPMSAVGCSARLWKYASGYQYLHRGNQCFTSRFCPNSSRRSVALAYQMASRALDRCIVSVVNVPACLPGT